MPPQKRSSTGKSARNRPQAARPSTKGADAARARSAGWRVQQQRQQRNRRMGLIALASTLVVVVILVVVLVIVERAGQKNDTKNLNAAAPAVLVNNLATVPASVFSSVGISGYDKTVAGLENISGTPDLTNGKPTLIYVGGEFCPYCAAQRWVLATALDRFGSFTGLETTRSAADDGNFATLTFVQAKYTSKYVAFDGAEIYNRARAKLQTLSKAAQYSYSKYGQVGSVPYFSVNNAYTGSYQYNPETIGTSTAKSIAAQIHAGKTQLGRDIVASANILTAALCKQTDNKPASVCSTSEVTAAAPALTSSTTKSGSSASPGSTPSSGSTP